MIVVSSSVSIGIQIVCPDRRRWRASSLWPHRADPAAPRPERAVGLIRIDLGEHARSQAIREGDHPHRFLVGRSRSSLNTRIEHSEAALHQDYVAATWEQRGDRYQKSPHQQTGRARLRRASNANQHYMSATCALVGSRTTRKSRTGIEGEMSHPDANFGLGPIDSSTYRRSIFSDW